MTDIGNIMTARALVHKWVRDSGSAVLQMRVTGEDAAPLIEAIADTAAAAYARGKADGLKSDLSMTDDSLIEIMARGIARRDSAQINAGNPIGILEAFDRHWPDHVARYREMCAKWPNYANASAFPNDAFRRARAALDALRAEGVSQAVRDVLAAAANKLGALSHHALWLAAVDYPADYSQHQKLVDHMIALCRDRLLWLAKHHEALAAIRAADEQKGAPAVLRSEAKMEGEE